MSLTRQGVTGDLVTATVGDEFAYKLSYSTSIMQNLYYLPSLNSTTDCTTLATCRPYRVTGNFGITPRLNGWLTANLLFNDRYNSQPVPGNKKNDVLLC